MRPAATITARWRRRPARCSNGCARPQPATMDFSMLWKDLLIGFLIAGVLGAFVPDAAWRALFLEGGSPGVRLVENALVGPVIAMLSFVCSIGNVPMAAI